MTYERVRKLALLAISIGMMPTAIQATFAPRTWFDDFPLGRGWVAAEGGSYDEHLVRDVGVLFIALIIVTVWSALTDELVRVVAVAWLVQGVLHVAYHAGHLDGLDTLDRFALIGTLVAIPALAGVALWADLGDRRSDSR
jgi:hypothetical protein